MGELGAMSKNNLRGITFGIRPIWGINSLSLLFFFFFFFFFFGIKTSFKQLSLMTWPLSEREIVVDVVATISLALFLCFFFFAP